MRLFTPPSYTATPVAGRYYAVMTAEGPGWNREIEVDGKSRFIRRGANVLMKPVAKHSDGRPKPSFDPSTPTVVLSVDEYEQLKPKLEGTGWT